MSTICLIIAIILFLIAGLLAAGIISGVAGLTLAYFGLAFFAAAHLPLP